jgi:hypothetical protein
MSPAPRRPIVTAMLALLGFLPIAAHAQPFHARGTFHAGGGAIWDALPGNQLHDDGVHGDGLAGDGVYAGLVISDQPPGYHEFKIATPDWSQAYPSHPVYVFANAVLYTFFAGEAVRFRLDTNALGGGWQPAANAVACDHFTFPGATFELIGSPPELGAWNFGVPASLEGGVWKVHAPIAMPGHHEFKFRVTGTWDIANIGVHYNMFLGDNFTFETTVPETWIQFEFNPLDGRARAYPASPTPVARTSWGAVRRAYR